MFNLMSNICSDFIIGERDGDDAYLEGHTMGDGEYLFNARIFTKDGSFGTVIDNFPRQEPSAAGWSRKQILDGEGHTIGYALHDNQDELIFSYSSSGPLCEVSVSLYDKQGKLVVTGGQGALVVRGFSFDMW